VQAQTKMPTALLSAIDRLLYSTLLYGMHESRLLGGMERQAPHAASWSADPLNLDSYTVRSCVLTHMDGSSHPNLTHQQSQSATLAHAP
jgi:hypothetical protein